MIRNLFSTLTLLWVIFATTAQETTKVRFYVKGGPTYHLKVDGELLPLSNVQYIAPGEHSLEIWSPMHNLYTGRLYVPAKDSISFYKELSKSSEYVAYLMEMDAYKRKVFAGKTAPLMAAMTGAVFTPILFYSRRKWNEELVKAQFKSNYLSGDTRAEADIRSRYNGTNAVFFTSAALAVGGVASYFILRPWLERQSKPTFSDQNPFTLERFDLGYDAQLNAPQLGLTFRF